MSKTTLKKLVEHYAPETVRKAISNIEAAEALERDARNERVNRENDLLKTLDRERKDRETPVVCLA